MIEDQEDRMQEEETEEDRLIQEERDLVVLVILGENFHQEKSLEIDPHIQEEKVLLQVLVILKENDLVFQRENFHREKNSETDQHTQKKNDRVMQRKNSDLRETSQLEKTWELKKTTHLDQEENKLRCNKKKSARNCRFFHLFFLQYLFSKNIKNKHQHRKTDAHQENPYR